MLHLIATVMALASASPVEPGALAPSDLISAMDILSSDQNESFSAQIRVWAGPGVPMTLNICWQPNGKYSLLWSATESPVPVALFTEAGFFVYDAVEGHVLRGSGMASNVSVSATDEKFVLDMGFHKATEEPPQFKLNLASFAIGPARVWSLDASDSAAVLSRVAPSGKSTLELTFQLADAIQLRQVCIREIETGEIRFEVSSICRGDGSRYIPLPELKGLPLPVIEWHADDEQVGVLDGFLVPLTRAVAAQAAVSNAQFRELPLFAKDIDWSAVEQRAASMGKALSELFVYPTH